MVREVALAGKVGLQHAVKAQITEEGVFMEGDGVNMWVVFDATHDDGDSKMCVIGVNKVGCCGTGKGLVALGKCENVGRQRRVHKMKVAMVVGVDTMMGGTFGFVDGCDEGTGEKGKGWGAVR
ncbi:hypothetical protein BWQ96_06556 [Gracilariopsis chorda]|uniref:Uncharacterized protein n=1 Tax=Gracilariopsis chorda TaxID=448386 RepID=A0A2V3INR7_9FLOR|nr:hypothetical protein BWQ96_06556 [Gracilariopsis chorda]|eukprot:PXF43726.1 hypothetical protein BWQ96_06556 [Gracilariopsis chorda]